MTKSGNEEKWRGSGGGDPWEQAQASGAWRRIDLLSLVPLVAIAALAIGVAALAWFVERSEVERARVKIATDALWVEQTLRFQLSIHEDLLVRLALEGVDGVPQAMFEARARFAGLIEDGGRGRR